MPTNSIPKPRRLRLSSALLLLAAFALAAYFFWGERSRLGFGSASLSGEGESASAQAGRTDGESPSAVYDPASQSAAATRGFGNAPVPTQAEIAANRVPNEAGIPSNGQPIPSAPRIPVQATPGEIIGYRVDENGVNHPLRAGDPGIVPNSPGTYAVVDPFADGGYAVVAVPKPGPRISQAELDRLRARERERERRRD